jgi:hypothetical protein
MTPEEFREAEKLLSSRPEYQWLTQSGKQWFNLTDVARGSGLSRDTVRGLCESGSIPGAVFYNPDIGWRLPYSGLVEYFARLLRGGSGQRVG